MLKTLWRHRVEFYPYLAIYLFWFLGAFLGSFQVRNRPGIVALGLVTVPSIVLITIATVRTWREIRDREAARDSALRKE